MRIRTNASVPLCLIVKNLSPRKLYSTPKHSWPFFTHKRYSHWNFLQSLFFHFCVYGTRRSLSLKAAEELVLSGPSNSGGVTVPGSFSAPVANFLPLWAKTFVVAGASMSGVASKIFELCQGRVRCLNLSGEAPKVKLIARGGGGAVPKVLLLCLEVEQRRPRFNMMSGATPKVLRDRVRCLKYVATYVLNRCQDRCQKSYRPIPGVVPKARVNRVCWWRHRRG